VAEKSTGIASCVMRDHRPTSCHPELYPTLVSLEQTLRLITGILGSTEVELLTNPICFLLSIMMTKSTIESFHVMTVLH